VLSALFWAVPYALWLRRKPGPAPGDIVAGAAATAAIAAAVDYLAMPRRLTPGWELALDRAGIVATFAGLGFGLAGARCWRGAGEENRGEALPSHPGEPFAFSRRSDAQREEDMTASSEAEEIQRIAYEIWQIEGEPFGRDHEHWQRANRIFESRRRSPGVETAAPPVTHDFKEVEPGMVPKMKSDRAPELPDPPIGRFARQLQDAPGERS
jgi:hypothetical protein